MNTAGKTTAFASIKAGDELPPLSHGILHTPHVMRWSAAIENWHRIHYDIPFATEHDGLPSLMINGSYKQHFILQMLREWAGPHGWVAKVAFQFRAMDLVGTKLTAWGRVLSTEVRHGLGYVEVELGIRNQDGAESTPGRATVVFPVDRVVPYPYSAMEQA